jgi:hypothetical protein
MLLLCRRQTTPSTIISHLQEPDNAILITKMVDNFPSNPWGEEPDYAKDADDDDDDLEDISPELVAAGSVIGAQHVLMLVDCNRDMFQPCTSSSTTTATTVKRIPMDMTLRAAERIIKERIRTTVTVKTGKRDGFGLILYNTSKRRRHDAAKEAAAAATTKSNPGEDVDGGIKKKNEEEDDGSGDDDDDDDDEEEDNDDDNCNDDPSNTGGGSTVHVLLPLSPPGIKQIQTIQACLQDHTTGMSRRVRDLQQEFQPPSSDTTDTTEEEVLMAPLQTALEESMRAFRGAKCVRDHIKPNEPVDTKAIWIFTNHCSGGPGPLQLSTNAQQLIQNVARDALEQKIQIIVWPLPLFAATTKDESTISVALRQEDPEDDVIEDAHFDFDQFYSSIVTSTPFTHRLYLDDHEILQDCMLDLQHYWRRLRRAYYGPLLLPDWKDQKEAQHIMVDWFKCVQLTKKPGKVTICQQTKQ